MVRENKSLLDQWHKMEPEPRHTSLSPDCCSIITVLLVATSLGRLPRDETTHLPRMLALWGR